MRIRRLAHARHAANNRQWHWNWRRLRVISCCRQQADIWARHEAHFIDAGYCLDRYMIGDEL